MTDQPGPEPYAGFQGEVRRTFAGSTPWWPPRPSAPEGAPNIIVMLVDDLGYSDIAPFGSEIPTPELERLAAEGVRLSNFHSTPLCSPSRAALLTGVNAHLAGVGYVSFCDPGFPGYAMELAQDVLTLPEALRANGYSTLMVGKWHLAKDADLSSAGPQHSWPVQRGFDRFYGFLDGYTNLHHPHRLMQDNSPVEVDQYPPGYYLTDDLTDRAISMILDRKAAKPRQPFFLYFAHGAVHAPLQAPADAIAGFDDGRYERGWDQLRDERHRRLLELGILPEGTRLSPRNTEEGFEVPAWDSLSAEQQRLYARYMAVYAAMIESIDRNLGRLRASLEAIGEWDNTIVVFTSDNGASKEGGETGLANYYTHLLAQPDLQADLALLDKIGGPQTTPHYPRGWAMVGNAPFRLYKIQTHAGGHQVPCLVSWPERMRDADCAGRIRPQYGHLIDVMPTLLDMAGVEAPDSRHGSPVHTMAGASLAESIFEDAPSPRTEQHYEMVGNRGFYRNGWEIVTLHRPLTSFDDTEWELYDLTKDPTELDDLASEHPELVKELSEAWTEAAWANQVFPLDEGTILKAVVRPDSVTVFDEPVTLLPGTPTLERFRSSRLIFFRSFTVRVELECTEGDAGWLFAHGDQGGGYGCFVEHGGLVFVYNNGRGRTREITAGRLAPGQRVVELVVRARAHLLWDVEVAVDGEIRAREEDLPMMLGMVPFEGISVGRDPRSPVSWRIHEEHGSFPWTGTLHSVRYEPGEHAPDAPGEQLIEAMREVGAAFE